MRNINQFSGIYSIAKALEAVHATVFSLGGEGSRRLTTALQGEQVFVERVHPNAALSALALSLKSTKPVWVLASGSSTSLCTRAISEAARLGVALRVLVLSHGEDEGETLPPDDLSDLAVFSLSKSQHYHARSATECASLIRTLSAMNAAVGPVVLSVQLRASALSMQSREDSRSGALDPLAPIELIGAKSDEPGVLVVASHHAAESLTNAAFACKFADNSVVIANVRRVKPFPSRELCTVVGPTTKVVIYDPHAEVSDLESTNDVLRALPSHYGPFSAQVVAALASATAAHTGAITVVTGACEVSRWLRIFQSLTEKTPPSVRSTPTAHCAWIVAEPTIKMQAAERVLSVLAQSEVRMTVECVEAERATFRWEGESTKTAQESAEEPLLVLNVPGLSVGSLEALAPTNAVCETLSQSDAAAAAARILQWVANTLPTEKAATIEQIERARNIHGDFQNIQRETS